MSDSSKPPKNNITNFLNKIRPRGASPGKTPPPNATKVKRSRTPIRFNLFSKFTSNAKSQSSSSSQSVENVAPQGSSDDGLNVTPTREESFNNIQELLSMTYSSPAPAPRAVSEVDLRLVTTDRGSVSGTTELKPQPQQFSSLTDVSGEIQSTPTSSPRQPSYLNISRALNGYGYRNRSSPLNTPTSALRPTGRSIVERRLQTFLQNEHTPCASDSSAPPSSSDADPAAMATAVAPEFGTPVRELASHFESLRVSTPAGPPRQVKAFARPLFPKTVPVNNPKADATSVIDGKYYERLLTETRDDLQKKVDEGLNLLNREEESMASEAADVVRVAQGKAALLIRKKLSKFEELVRKNLNPDSNSKLQETTVSDLEGYWALIDFELKDIQMDFEKVEEWRSRNWQQPASTEQEASPKEDSENKSPPPKPARRIKPPVKGPPKEKTEKEKARDEERRRQIGEFRKKALMAKKQHAENEKENDLIVH